MTQMSAENVGESEPDEALLGIMRSATVLCVDDEPNILSSLRRLLRPLQVNIVLANSGAEGLEAMQRQPADLVISDMRMPEMDGATFLTEIARRWPETVRILLTGYADLGSTIKAINEGHIFRYISKPWEENDVRITVQRALERKALLAERRRLVALTRQQNEQLKQLNATLETRVKQRTEELKQTSDFLEIAYQELKSAYRDAIPVFTQLLELREGIAAGHGRRVAEMAQETARTMALSEIETDDIYYAALLHDIGRIGLSDEILERPYVDLTPPQQRELQKHPAMGEMAVNALAPMENAARLIRSHHERFDGGGYPDGLKGEAIPLGARIIAVANDFDTLQTGLLMGQPYSRDEAKSFIGQNRGKRYDTAVVDAFFEMLEHFEHHDHIVSEVRLTPDALKPEMVLARDLVAKDGMLLLTKGRILDENMIGRLQMFARDQGKDFLVAVRTELDL